LDTSVFYFLSFYWVSGVSLTDVPRLLFIPHWEPQVVLPLVASVVLVLLLAVLPSEGE
jgi:phosphate starvation-inducible membrane PsiE